MRGIVLLSRHHLWIKYHFSWKITIEPVLSHLSLFFKKKNRFTMWATAKIRIILLWFHLIFFFISFFVLMHILIGSSFCCDLSSLLLIRVHLIIVCQFELTMLLHSLNCVPRNAEWQSCIFPSLLHQWPHHTKCDWCLDKWNEKHGDCPDWLCNLICATEEY